MKLGVKEFRERFSEIADGSQPVFVTKNGRIVGKYQPMLSTEERVHNWAEISARLEKHREEWKARTPDWKQRMADYGLTPDGDMIDP